MPEVGRNTKIAVEEMSNIKGYRGQVSKHNYENIPNCLHFVCKMFSQFEIKSLEYLKLKDYVIENKVNTNNKRMKVNSWGGKLGRFKNY